MMKKSLLTCVLITGFFHQKDYAQCVPDLNFRQVINIICPNCLDTDGCLTASADSVTALDVHGQNIEDLTGIEGFTHLQQFYCHDNLITTVPPLSDSIQLFYCSDNLITSLPAVLPTNLEQFKCENNQLSALPPLPAKLKLFYCSGNSLSSLPVLPSKLDNLYCNDNSLTYLPPLPDLITSLHCNANPITQLPPLPPNLEKLYCSKNLLKGIPELPATLTTLDVSYNKISCLPKLPAGLQFLNYDSTYISCLPNLPVAFVVAPPLPLCVNQSGDSCALNPTISGQVYVDYNGNGVKDAGDINFPGVHVTANEGNWAGYTADDGSFSMKTGFDTTYNITVIPPAGEYTIFPLAYTLSFDDSTNQSISNVNFGLYPNLNNYDLSVSLTAGRLSPGIETNYYLSYSNLCPFAFDGAVQLEFDVNHLNYIDADIAPTTQNGNLLKWVFTALQPFTTKTIRISFDIPSNVVPGTELLDTAQGVIMGAADVNPSNNKNYDSSTVYSVTPSNYKTVSISMLTPEDAVDTTLEYSIYFQNSGEETAEDIEVFDTLSGYLTATDFEIISVSHPNIFEITNEEKDPSHPLILHWSFNGIHMPPVSQDQLNSYGYITFKSKLLPTPLGAEITNRAALIFSNLAAITMTNTVTTSIAYPIGIPEASPTDENLEVFPNPFHDAFIIKYKNEVKEIVVVRVYNEFSQLIRERVIIPGVPVSLNMEQFPAGPYLITVSGNHVNDSRKIWKQ
jgi:hypothetical protein